MAANSFYIVGNWKSNKTLAEAVTWLQDVTTFWKQKNLTGVSLEIILCPSLIHFSTLASMIHLARLPIVLGAQDVSAFENGAYTGYTSAAMLKDLVRYTLVGHSERRKYAQETDADLVEKVKQAKAAGIEPIYCVQSVDTPIPDDVSLVAYEPVWAIGTGKPETAANAGQVAAQLRAKTNRDLTVIYGGSVTPQNIQEYVTSKELRGVLPGKASLDAQMFIDLITNASTQ